MGCEALPTGPAASAPRLESYTAINPQRLVDTRNNIGGWGTTIGAGCTMRINLAADVPANAAAVSLALTAIADGRDYLTVYPCASGRPDTSNLNTRPGIPTPNVVVAMPDVNREICIFSHGTVHLIVDLAGWWSEGPDRFASIAPVRVYDTRRSGGSPLARFVVREVQDPGVGDSVECDRGGGEPHRRPRRWGRLPHRLPVRPAGPAVVEPQLHRRRGPGGRGDRRARRSAARCA